MHGVGRARPSSFFTLARGENSAAVAAMCVALIHKNQGPWRRRERTNDNFDKT